MGPFKSFLCLLPLLMLAQCARQPRPHWGDPSLPVGHPHSSFHDIPINGVTFYDGKRPDKLEVLFSPTASRNSEGQLVVSVFLRNKGSRPCYLEGRGYFFNAKRVLSEGPTPWTLLTVDPHTTAVFQVSSTRVREAAYYYVEMRQAKETLE